MSSSSDSAPLTAFVVSGQCRASWAIARENDTVAATNAFLASYAKHVHRPHAARAGSTVFLLLKEREPGACGGESLCERHFPGAPCRFIALPSRSAECESLAQPRVSKCFRKGVYGSTPFWCTMGQAWAAVARHQQEAATPPSSRFERVVFSRIDQLYTRSFGKWSDYIHEWHSAHIICHDMLWIMSRRVAACALNVSATMASCTFGAACCNPKWYASWWVWSYCTAPHVLPGVRHLYGVAGSFDVETRRDGLRECAGAPLRTDPRVSNATPPLERRLVDYSGRLFASNPHPYQG